MKIKLTVTLLLLLSFGETLSQGPCTDRTAYQTTGKWSVFEDDLAMADPTLPKSQFQTVLPKAQKVIDLIRRATPDLAGVEARSYRSIRGRSYVSGGAVLFGTRVGYFGYYCVPDTPSFPELRGKVRLGGESDTWIEVFFNSLGWLLNEKTSLGKELLTVNGEMIYVFPSKADDLKGFDLLQPEIFREKKNEAVVIVPDGRRPYKILSREDYLRAQILYYEKKIKKAQTLSTAGPLTAEYQDYIANFNQILNEMPPRERQAPAFIRNFAARPLRDKIFVEESAGGKPLATLERSFFTPIEPRHTVQFMTVYWRWNDKNPPKAAIIRQFKENFDFQALKEMLGK